MSVNSQGGWNYGGGRLEGNWEALGSVYPGSPSFSARLECSLGVQLPEQVRTVSGGGDKEPHPESELGVCWALTGGRGRGPLTNIRFHTCVSKRIRKLQLHMAGEAQYLFGDFFYWNVFWNMLGLLEYNYNIVLVSAMQ